jgi:hypothetical protein
MEVFLKVAERALVDYYDGTYGPTIRVVLTTEEQLLQFKGAFESLAKGEVPSLSFHHLPFVEVMGLEELNLVRVPDQRVGTKSIKLTRGRGKDAAFLWTNSDEGWSRCAGLIDGLIGANRPCHQYLTDGDLDDALVVFAWRE